MHLRRQSAALILGAALTIIFGTARGQVAAPANAQSAPTSRATKAATAATPQPSARAQAAPSALPDLPANVFADAPTDPAAAAKKQEHLQKIRQLAFDRRPSAILKAWSMSREDAIKQAENPTPQQPMPGNPGMPLSVARAARRAVTNMATTVINPAAAASNAAGAQAPADSFDHDLQGFRYDVTLGDWKSVRQFLVKLPEDEGKALYEQLIQGLGSFPGTQMNPQMQQQMQMQMQMQQQMQMQMQMGMNYGAGSPQPPNPQQFMMEQNAFSNQDILDLAHLAPHGLDENLLTGLGRILRLALDSGDVIEDFLNRLRVEVKRPASEAPLSDRQAVKVLIAANCTIEAGEFLPAPDRAEKDNDREALNLLARTYLAQYARDKKTAFLENAWKVTQAALAVGTIDRAQKDEAIRRAVELTPKISESLGRAWLEESFTTRPERGMEIIAAIGAESTQGLQTHAFDSDFRLKAMTLQKLAVEALLQKAPQRGKEWGKSLALLAEAWLREAEFSYYYDFSTSLGPRMHYDAFGNMYYSNYDPFSPEMMARQRGLPMALKVADVVKERPGAAWMSFVDEGIKPRFATVFARLYLKVNEEDEAFPYIEQLAKTNTREAKELAEEFVRVWTRNHDPNSQQMRRSRFFYIYGFENRAEGIPLTRSKQERNLVELAAWVKKLRALPIGEIDEKLLTKAFTACHSTAEVYRLDAIEKVFGSFNALNPRALAELIQQMRGNLIGAWRQPAEQERQKTKRREKDIRAEVLRGYEVALAVTDRGLARHPDDWSLVLARASLMHDENNYRQLLERSADFAPRRSKAMAEFHRAARLYVASLPKLEESDETTEVFDTWYCAAVGAVDPPAITEETLADPRQFPAIREAILAIPGEPGARHMGKFANSLFLRLTQIKPSVKFRYLKSGFEIVGDHPQAYDARKVFDYYKDLVTEIKLDAKIDGGDVVGHERPFGVFVNIRHTREIERESGGFGRYLQNQNNTNSYYYNFGRPLENYRDKFQEGVKQAVGEQFEVISVTFQDDKVNSRAASEYGWRVTPYAYLLLRAREPKVDRLPPLRLDFDFMDTSGYVVLPVESPTVPLDAGPAKGETRPFEKLQLVQTLDERQAKDGKLILEVKATARGLVPEIGEILTLDRPGFQVDKVDDQGVAVSKFDPDSDAIVIDSERTCLVSYRAAENQDKPPALFHFASAKIDGVDMTYQRYVDADLAKVGPEVSLEARYEVPRTTWILWTCGIFLAVALVAVAAIRLLNRPTASVAERFPIPDPLTPFTVLALLHAIQRQCDLSVAQMNELDGAISRVERHYFADAAGEPIDLHQLATSWIQRVS